MRITLLVVILSAAGACGKKPDTPVPASAPGSASGTPVADAAPPPADAAAADVAAPPPIDAVANYYETDLCITVLTRTVECEKDKRFIAALDAGADAATKRQNARIRKSFHENISGIHDARDRCDFLSHVNFEHSGFLSRWEVLAAAPADVFASCAALGALVAKADGLPGGQMAN